VDGGEKLTAGAGGRKVSGVFDAKGVNVLTGCEQAVLMEVHIIPNVLVFVFPKFPFPEQAEATAIMRPRSAQTRHF
jgi:hypothetical protein